MKDHKKQFQLNAGKGMAGGVIIGALIALIVSTVTGDNAIWTWIIPVSLACGLAVGAGRPQSHNSKEM